VKRIGRKSAEDGGAKDNTQQDLDDDERHDAGQSQPARDGKGDRHDDQRLNEEYEIDHGPGTAICFACQPINR
jgi:hypothetical protein